MGSCQRIISVLVLATAVICKSVSDWRNIHIFFTDDTFRSNTRQQLVQAVKEALRKASFEFSTVLAKGFEEGSSAFNSYIIVLLKDVSPE